VRSRGVLLAQSEQLASGEFAWLHFTSDGGSTGREIDLELSSVPDQHWHLVALAIPDPSIEIPQLVLTNVTADSLIVSGRPAALTALVANTSDSDLSATVRVVVPDGWSATDATSTIAAGAIAEFEITVIPDGDPVITSLQVEAAVGGGAAADRLELQVMAVPTADSVTLALDAGTTSSPVLPDYRRLSPGETS